MQFLYLLTKLRLSQVNTALTYHAYVFAATSFVTDLVRATMSTCIPAVHFAVNLETAAAEPAQHRVTNASNSVREMASTKNRWKPGSMSTVRSRLSTLPKFQRSTEKLTSLTPATRTSIFAATPARANVARIMYISPALRLVFNNVRIKNVRRIAEHLLAHVSGSLESSSILCLQRPRWRAMQVEM